MLCTTYFKEKYALLVLVFLTVEMLFMFESSENYQKMPVWAHI